MWKKEQMVADYPENRDSFEKEYNFTERIKHEGSIFHNCEFVIATTPIQVDKIETDYGIDKKKIKMIPPGYDDNRFYPVGEPSREAMRDQYGFSGRVIFAVSRLALNKGADLLIHGFSVLKERMEDAKLVLALGHEERSDSEEKLYQELIRLQREYKLQESISFTGFIPDEELPDYYRACDLFVLPSRYEPFGMTAIEAAACGTPTVVTIHGGLFRILDYGLNTMFADPLDKQDLGITMMKPLRYRNLRTRLRNNGAQTARSKFTWTGIAQQLLNVADSIQTGSSGFYIKPKDELS